MMAHKKRSGPEDALDKAMGVVGEAVGRVGGDENLEAEGRVLRRKGELKTYLVKPHADGGWKVQAEEATRATSVHRTKAEAVAAAKELARSKTPSQLLVYKADGLEAQEEKTYE
jgi:uncharacterized protein YjbJ (UPF0337 family)